MSSAVTSPVAWDLTVAPMSAKVKVSGVTADSDGFYYAARQLVEIVADETVGIATNAQKAIGQLEDSITIKTNPNGLDARTRVSVIPFGFRRVLRMTAEGDLTYGTWVTQGSVSKQAVKAASTMAATATATVDASALAGSIAAGETPVTSTAAQPAVTIAGAVTATVTPTLAGGVPPERIIGIIWKGATSGNEVLVLAY